MAYVEVVGKHDTCPRCGSRDTYQFDSNEAPDNTNVYFPMHCEGCGKIYDSVFVPSKQCYEESDK